MNFKLNIMRFNRNILLVGISLLLSLTAVFSFYHLLPLLLLNNGFAESSLGTLYTVFLFSYNAGQLLGGFLLKRIDARRLYALSTLLVALLFALLYLPLTKALLATLLFVIYLLWGIQLPPQGVIVHAAEEDTTRSFSQIEFFALLGILIGPFVGYGLLKFMSLKGVILFAAGLEILVTVIRWNVRDKKDGHGENIRFPRFSRKIVLITVFVSLAFFVFYSTSDGPFIPAILKKALSMDLRQISFLYGISTLISIGFIPVFYLLAKKYGMWKVMGISVFVHGLLIYLWSLQYPALILLVLGFVTVQPTYTYFMPLLMDSVSERERGGVLGAVGFISGTVGSLSPILLGRLGNPFIITCAVSIVAALITLVIPFENQGVKKSGI